MKAFTRKFASEAVAERQGSLLKIRIGCLMLGLLSLVLSASAQVSGSGAHNYVPIWTSAATLGNSTIFETGGKVGIGNTSPGATLDVTGANGGGNGGNAPMALQIKGGSGARGSGIVGGSGAPVNLTAGSGGISTAGGGAGGPMLLTAGSGGLPNGLGGSVVVGAGNGGNGFNSAGVGGIVLFTGGGGGTALLHRAHGGGAGTIPSRGRVATAVRLRCNREPLAAALTGQDFLAPSSWLLPAAKLGSAQAAQRRRSMSPLRARRLPMPGRPAVPAASRRTSGRSKERWTRSSSSREWPTSERPMGNTKSVLWRRMSTRSFPKWCLAIPRTTKCKVSTTPDWRPC
jgi:hypothetical protein